MPRIRAIKPEFFHDEDLASLSAYDRLLFIGLWCYADREGRLEDRPRRLRAQIFPYEAEDVDVDAGLDRLAAAHFIVRYADERGRYLQVRTFAKHQRPHVKEPPSTYPAPTQHLPSTHPASVGMENGSRNGSGSGGKSGKPDLPSRAPLAGHRNIHAKHAMCKAPYCVPEGSWLDLVAAAGGEAEARAYVHQVWAELDVGPSGAPPLDLFKFWRTHWEADHPQPTAAELQRRKSEAAVRQWVPRHLRGEAS